VNRDFSVSFFVLSCQEGVVYCVQEASMSTDLFSTYEDEFKEITDTLYASIARVPSTNPGPERDKLLTQIKGGVLFRIFFSSLTCLQQKNFWMLMTLLTEWVLLVAALKRKTRCCQGCRFLLFFSFFSCSWN
jgi:hypothetical protein